MSKAFNVLTRAIARMYGNEASKFESVASVFNGLVEPLHPDNRIDVAKSIIEITEPNPAVRIRIGIDVITDALESENNLVPAADLALSIDKLVAAAEKLESHLRELEATERELARNPI